MKETETTDLERAVTAFAHALRHLIEESIDVAVREATRGAWQGKADGHAMNQKPSQIDYLDARELQVRLKLKRRDAVYDLVARGMPCYRLGRRMRFDYEKVVRWLEARK